MFKNVHQLKKKSLALWLAIPMAILTVSCELEDPPPFGRAGNQVRFAGRDWVVKTGPSQLGPGPNFFSDKPEDIFLDGQGYLHMRIAEHDGIWYATELVGEDTVGYGEYTWVIAGDYENIPENTVLGLFTWNTESFKTQANSEVDIELAKWGNVNTKPLHTSVQPVNFGPYYPERTREADTEAGDLIGVTTHQFIWTEDVITWKSWKGRGTGGALIWQWSYSKSNPNNIPRVKNENGNSSDPIVIPAPENNTNVRMNHWLLGGVPPLDGQVQEAIIMDFTYVPY